MATLVAAGSFVVSLVSGQWVAGTLMLVFYFIGGIGIRERNRYAAVVVFVVYALEAISAGLGIVRIIFAALLLSNVRATFIASRWKAESEEAAIPPRLSETLSDRFSDQLPMWLWPKIRIPYYIFSSVLLALMAVGLVVMTGRGVTR
ncbi:MAG TPA: hypothetical protein VLE48_14640 [Terriglobales bacterium]|nr:hypothetical protein [Terriglobales bacterium]